MNSRGALLISADDFHASLKRSAEDVAALESAALEDDALQHAVIAGKLWTVIERLRLTETRAQLVTSTKSLHHLLPSLVVPMDRQFTGAFFRWNNQAWQVTQERSFKTAFGVFANIARQVKPSQYIGSGWNTSATKVLDNALVSFCRRHELDKASRDKAILARATELGLLGDLASKAGKRKT